MRFSLIPYRPCPVVERIDGDVRLVGSRLQCTWMVALLGSGIAWPPETDSARRFGLWEHTCFELFIGPVADTAYVEFNLSPSGHWNSFDFSDTRDGMRASERLKLDRCRVTAAPDDRVRVISAAIAFIPWDNRDLAIGVSAVVEDRRQSLHYFALRHTGARPDFHDRANHTLIISGT